jgi:hypothetical protein
MNHNSLAEPGSVAAPRPQHQASARRPVQHGRHDRTVVPAAQILYWQCSDGGQTLTQNQSLQLLSQTELLKSGDTMAPTASSTKAAHSNRVAWSNSPLAQLCVILKKRNF